MTIHVELQFHEAARLHRLAQADIEEGAFSLEVSGSCPLELGGEGVAREIVREIREDKRIEGPFRLLDFHFCDIGCVSLGAQVEILAEGQAKCVFQAEGERRAGRNEVPFHAEQVDLEGLSVLARPLVLDDG